MKTECHPICRVVALSAFLAPGLLPAQGMAQGVQAPMVINPYAGMFGSMGNVYSPYYRQFHPYGMSGMAGPVNGAANIWGNHYIVSPNPYGGMFGSMGNVYSPYYRQFHRSGMSGPTGTVIPGGNLGQHAPYHYPYFLPPMMGTM